MFPRSPEDYRSQERRRGLVYVAAGVAALYVALTALSSVWTDYLWFQSVGYESVWRVNLTTSLLLGTVGVVVVFGFVYVNLVVTDRLSPRLEGLELTEEEELVERFREWAEPRLKWLRLAVSAGFALLLGVALADWRSPFLQFMNPVAFGINDPQFDTDLAFYMFRLPLWSLLANWVFNVVALVLIFVVALHYLNGGIRLQRGARPSVRGGVKTHISLLAASLAVLRAVGYWLDRYELLYTQHDNFFGAGFTDINARLPATQLLILVSLAAAVLFLFNIRRPGWTLALVSVGAWLFVSVAAGALYPSLVQRFRVDPGPLEREREFIGRNLEATKAAYGLDTVVRRNFAANRELTYRQLVDDNDLTVSNLRLWDPDVLTRTYQNLQELAPYYRLDFVDTDRYLVDGQMTQVMVAARELDETGYPERNWQTIRLIYTHGFGMALSPANEVEEDGQPSLWVRNVPPVSEKPDDLPVDNDAGSQTRSYFGETYTPGAYVIVKTGTSPQEADFPLAEGFSRYEYTGEAGVEMGSILRRLAFALRFRDLNILISAELRPDSRVLMERNVRQMVENIAPFLESDSDPYPVLLNGRLTYVVDLYTVSNRYPYSQPWRIEDSFRLPIRSGLPARGPNYVRNSVKATVDAYDGTVRFYITDDHLADPVIDTWAAAYPDVFLDEAEMPETLVEHLRYPQDMFKLQTELYLQYHVDDIDEFFTGVDAWSIPPDPSTVDRSAANALLGDRTALDTGATSPADGILPYYVTLSLPGDENDDLSYVLMQPFNALNRPNMTSFLVADSTPGEYGRLIDYRMPRGSLVDGTGQIGQRIDQNDLISSQFTLWRGQGSEVLLGDMLVIPIEESLLYVVPVYLEAASTGGGIPEFRRVVVVFGDRIEWAETLDEALAMVFGEDPPLGVPEGGGGEGDPEFTPQEPPSGSVAELIEQARRELELADQALLDGDLGAYQDFVERARTFIDQAAAQGGISEEEAFAMAVG
ncbi:MAG: UPF0182 family protein [Acidimicrobiia bacterium]